MKQLAALIAALAVLIFGTPIQARDRAPEEKIPISGPEIAGMEIFDSEIPQLLQRWKIPGAAVAVARDERLVFARGYGYANIAQHRLVQPTTSFRIASVSKVVTATAILQLVEQLKLGLDERVFDILTGFEPKSGESRDSRIAFITVRHLLNHTGGWDRTAAFDPVDRYLNIAQENQVTPPGKAEHMIRYMLKRPLQFDPGTQFAYSNFGYILLGEIVAKRSGQTYAGYVQEHVLEPAGIKSMLPGRSRWEEQLPEEATYYDETDAPLVESVFDPDVKVSRPYGGSCLEIGIASSGWVASAPDLLRLLAAVDGQPNLPDVLSNAAIAGANARPLPPLPQNSGDYYGFGRYVQSRRKATHWWHTGALHGSASQVTSYSDGVSVAILLNGRYAESAFEADIEDTIARCVRSAQVPRSIMFTDDTRPKAGK